MSEDEECEKREAQLRWLESKGGACAEIAAVYRESFARLDAIGAEIQKLRKEFGLDD